MKLSDNLKIIRKDNNLSQEQLAEKLGVSRQAVSKWESGLSYPEMDKVLLICKLFSYNIDELMNENIKEVDETKQSKININKYIDDFFGFITKTVDMFSSMTLKQKLKCFIEQIWVVGFLVLILLIIAVIGSSILSGIFNGLPIKIYYIIRNIFESIYLILSLVLGITITLHIFKIRYLDYYEIVKEDQENINCNENEENKLANTQDIQDKVVNDKKILINNNKQKIIIRDPGHSQSKFLTGIFRLIISFIKFMAICLGLVFVSSFVILIATLILSFLFIKTGTLFIGSLLCLLSAICINFIIIKILYNFIISKQSKKTQLAISFIISIILAGVGIGLIFIGITNFDYNDNLDTGNVLDTVQTFSMNDSLSIQCYFPNVEYVTTDSEDIKIVVKHSKYYTPNINKDFDENLQIYLYNDESNIMEFIRDIINDINNKELKNYYNAKVYIYASQENINKLNENKTEKENQRLENTIERLYEDNNMLKNEIYNLNEEIQEKEHRINDLKMQLEEITIVQ